MIGHEHVKSCVGKWVICHTRHGNYHGRLISCCSTHVVMHIPRNGTISALKTGNETFENSFGSNTLEITPAYWGGWGSVAIPLAAIAGLTIIGASALRW